MVNFIFGLRRQHQRNQRVVVLLFFRGAFFKFYSAAHGVNRSPHLLTHRFNTGPYRKPALRLFNFFNGFCPFWRFWRSWFFWLKLKIWNCFRFFLLFVLDLNWFFLRLLLQHLLKWSFLSRRSFFLRLSFCGKRPQLLCEYVSRLLHSLCRHRHRFASCVHS